MTRAYIFFIVFIGGIDAVLVAQKMLPDHQYLFMSVSGSYGYIAPHHESIRYFTEDYTQAYQIEAGWKTRGGKRWHHQHKFPNVGFGYYYSGLSNDEVFGQARAFYGFLQSGGGNQFRRVNFSQKLSVGISHLSEKYNLRKNPYNLAIGSHLNVYLAYKAGLDLHLTEEMVLNTGISFTHFSNGKIKEPNKGLNNVALSAGLTYKFNKHARQVTSPSEDIDIDSSNDRWLVIYAMGWKQISRRVDRHFIASSLSLNYAFFSRPTLQLGAGVDIFYDSSTKAHRIFDNQQMEGNHEYYRSGIHLSYAYIVGRTSFVVQPGVYIFNPYNKFGNGYNRLALQYRPVKAVIAHIAVKAHFPAKADFIEWGIGYSF